MGEAATPGRRIWWRREVGGGGGMGGFGGGPGVVAAAAGTRLAAVVDPVGAGVRRWWGVRWRWWRLRGGGGGGARGWSRNRAAVNRIRGNFTEQYTNSAFDAHPYPLNVAESPQIPSYRETFGFSLGGPLVIPHVYRGGNKTSWFASYNLQRGRTGLDSFSTVPTAAERTGDFSDTVIASGQCAGTVPTIYDPLSSATGARTPFLGNTIPTPRINSAATGLLPLHPPAQPSRRGAELPLAGAVAQFQ